MRLRESRAWDLMSEIMALSLSEFEGNLENSSDFHEMLRGQGALKLRNRFFQNLEDIAELARLEENGEWKGD